jgi:hypothetical protein
MALSVTLQAARDWKHYICSGDRGLVVAVQIKIIETPRLYKHRLQCNKMDDTYKTVVN